MKKLAEELERLVAMQNDLAGLARVTVGLLEKGDYEALDDAWAKRRALFKRLNAARKRVQPAMDQWGQTLAGLPAREAKRCEEAVRELETSGREILDQDAKAKDLLEKARSEFKGNLDRINTGRKVVKAYGAKRPPIGPVRISKSG